jgi:hypothetical protein
MGWKAIRSSTSKGFASIRIEDEETGEPVAIVYGPDKGTREARAMRFMASEELLICAERLIEDCGYPFTTAQSDLVDATLQAKGLKYPD